MIRYALACDQAHEFESWFPSSDAYDAQRKRGLVACPVCGSGKVDKQIMAPRLAGTDREPTRGPPAPVPSAPAPAPVPHAPAPQPMAIFSEKEREVRAMLKAFREHIQQNADHVGDRFPEEARKMHYGESEHRSIYGDATPMEAREMIEEGIEIHPLPIIADERN